MIFTMGKQFIKYLNNGLDEMGCSLQFFTFSKRSLKKYKHINFDDLKLPKNDNAALKKDILVISNDMKRTFNLTLNEQQTR
jgi:hypothetical protein